MSYKQGEELVRYCKKTRESGYTTTHDFTIYSDCFELHNDKPEHIQRLLHYLGETFTLGWQMREQTASKMPRLDLEVEPYDSDLVKYAKNSNYHGWFRNQHPMVQRHLHNNDPLTISTEAPVWSEDVCGFIDVIRIHEDSRIEVSDFKPKAAKEKNAPTQVHHLMDMLIKALDIKPKWVFGTYFDDEDCFILKS